MAYTASKLLEIARAELGYKEKETNSQLDDKTANAGDGNWTKYARDLYAAGYYQAAKNGYAWCDMWVDWVFLQLAGSKEKGEWLECQTGMYGAGCEWSSDCYRRAGRFDKDPKPGDQIFFGKTNAEDHTGIVEKIEDGKVHTIEGNASNMVKRCTYSLTNHRIVGYGHPRFDAEPEVEEEYDPVDTEPEIPESPAGLKFKVSDIVNFNGTYHYASANASTGAQIKAGKAKITAIHKSGKHPYHCRAVNDAGNFIGGVYGWVNAADLSAIVAETPVPKPTTPTTPATPAAIKKGDIVSIAKIATYYSGKDIPDWVVAKTWIVAETPVGDRVVINKSVDGKHAINSPVHAKFLTVVKADEPWTPKVGDIVNYNGNKHYANANAANGSSCKGGLAKITNIYQLGKSKHPYHLVRVSGKGATVYGWVNEGTFTKA